VLVGSDAVYNGFGLNMRELTWFVKMGMTNEEALQKAPVNAAEALAWRRASALSLPVSSPILGQFRATRCRYQRGGQKRALGDEGRGRCCR